MEIIINPEPRQWTQILQRPYQNITAIENQVKAVFNAVSKQGDKAVKTFTLQFDGVQLQQFKVKERTIHNAENKIPTTLKQAIQIAKANITNFHNGQTTVTTKVETMPGVTCWQSYKPIQHVGIYIPGGTAPLISTVLMLAIPAQLAGCKAIHLCTPPNQNAEVLAAILYAAKLCGISNIYTVGGIQAIAALTFGTETIPKVDKIFGPGNQFVTAAKQMATRYGLAIDMPAGPSELLVMADATANPNFVAADVLSQAEHGADSQVILVTTSLNFAKQVFKAIAIQVEQLPRKGIAKQALSTSKCIVVNTSQQAVEIINFYAPEHLIIATKNSDFFVENVSNAGSVFIGNYTPESAGDYASGTNHTLPTNGYSKAYSGVSVTSFQKSMTYQSITKQGLQNIGKTVEVLAEAEGLQAHKNAVSIRLNSINNE